MLLIIRALMTRDATFAQLRARVRVPARTLYRDLAIIRTVFTVLLLENGRYSLLVPPYGSQKGML